MARQPDDALERLLTRTLHSQTANGEVCPSAEDVAAYLERSLDAEEARRIELHLSSCARCAETLATLVETEPLPSSARPSPAWWSWSVWRWAAPAAAVVVIGVWFASTLPDGREPATRMAQYDQTKEQPKAEAAAASPSESESAVAAPVTPDESARKSQGSLSPRREADQQGAIDSIQPLDDTGRGASQADAAAARSSTSAQPSPEQPRALAKAEESRADAAAAERRESAIAGFAAPAAPPVSPAAPPPVPPVAEAAGASATAAAATAPATAAAAAAPRESATARAAGGAARAASEAASPPSTLRQQTAETQERARTVAGFAPLVLRTRSGNVLWRITGSVVERSVDGGTTWATEFRAPRAISTGVVAADDTAWLAGAGGLVLRRPANGGWQIVPPPVRDDLTGISEPAATSVTVTTADGRRFRTTDTGATWMAR